MDFESNIKPVLHQILLGIEQAFPEHVYSGRNNKFSNVRQKVRYYQIFTEDFKN